MVDFRLVGFSKLDISSPTLSEMPFYNISTYQLIDDIYTNGVNVKNDLRDNVSFYNNLKSKCNGEILKAVDFSYNTEDEFNDLYRSSLNSIELSVFHINIWKFVSVYQIRSKSVNSRL